jgi:hypothetical protein
MFNLPCNIDKRGRIVRGTIGGLLIIGAILGLGHIFAILLGLILIAEAALNYCVIIDMIQRFNLDSDKPKTPPKT